MTERKTIVATKVNDLEPGEAMTKQPIDLPTHLQVELNKTVIEFLQRIDPDTKHIFVQTAISVQMDIAVSATDPTLREIPL